MLLRVVFSIISTDPDFVVDMTDLLRAAARLVYVAANFEEDVALQRRVTSSRCDVDQYFGTTDEPCWPTVCRSLDRVRMVRTLTSRRSDITTVDANPESVSTVPLFRCQLVREGPQESSKTSTDPITHPAELVKVVEPLFAGADREIFVALALDARNRPIGTNIVSAGKLTASMVHPRETFKFAILANAAAVTLANNHPPVTPPPRRRISPWRTTTLPAIRSPPRRISPWRTTTLR